MDDELPIVLPADSAEDEDLAQSQIPTLPEAIARMPVAKTYY